MSQRLAPTHECGRERSALSHEQRTKVLTRLLGNLSSSCTRWDFCTGATQRTTHAAFANLLTTGSDQLAAPPAGSQVTNDLPHLF